MSSENPQTVPTRIPGYLAGRWKVDPVHSGIDFSVKQMLVSTVHGRFTGYDVTIVTGANPLESSVSATIEVASVDTGNKRRDHHLRTGDYLAVETQPTATYRSTGVRQADAGWLVDGELTMLGCTVPVPLDVEVQGFSPDPAGGRRADFSATAKVNRRDFGIDGGAGLISDTVSISLKIHAVLQA